MLKFNLSEPIGSYKGFPVFFVKQKQFKKLPTCKDRIYGVYTGDYNRCPLIKGTTIIGYIDGDGHLLEDSLNIELDTSWFSETVEVEVEVPKAKVEEKKKVEEKPKAEVDIENDPDKRIAQLMIGIDDYLQEVAAIDWDKKIRRAF